MLNLTDPSKDLSIPHHRDPYYSGGEEIHPRQLISEDELVSGDMAHIQHNWLVSARRNIPPPSQTAAEGIHEKLETKSKFY